MSLPSPCDNTWMSWLRCPQDGAELSPSGEVLRCASCASVFPIENGIPNFLDAEMQTQTWQAAQRYELGYWNAAGGEQIGAARDRFAEGARQLADTFDRFAQSDWRERVLQVGPAALGEIHFLPARERYAIEPLATALDARGLLERDDLRWVCGMGEHLPFPSASFSAVIIPNVLDHVADPLQVLKEIRRCLAPGGLVWLSSHVSSLWVVPVLRLMHKTGLGYFAGHPWYFSPAGLDGLAAEAGLRPLSAEMGASQDSESKGRWQSYAKRRLLAVRYLMLTAD